jgi:pyruvate,water dikinase
VQVSSDWVLSYAAAFEAGPARVGGKGWNLARLDRLGFDVPAGGVLIADAQRVFRETGELPPEAEAGIRQFLATHGLESAPLAVRSSAAAEDSPTASFAGMHDSVLDVRGADDVLRAIRVCYASMHSARAIAYREHFGLSDDSAAFAVVACAMVPGILAAGVAFSVDPRTGRRDRLAITAGRGRGDALESGVLVPEEVLVSIGAGACQIVEQSGPGVLSEREYLRLARLVQRIEWALGDGQVAQDVEWAFDGERFWLLQARPVTARPRVTVSFAQRQPVYWSNANLSDAIAGVPTPLTWSLLAPFLDTIMYAPLARGGYTVPSGMEVVRRFDGRAYLDLTSVQAIYFDALGLTPAETNRHVGATVEITLPQSARWRGIRGRLGLVRMLAALLPHPPAYAAYIRHIRATTRALRNVDVRGLSNLELLQHAGRILSLQLEFGTDFQTGNVDAGVWYEPLARTIERTLPGQGERLASALMAGSGRIVTAEHGYALVRLAALAAAEPAACAYVNDHAAEDAWAWRDLPADSAFRQGMEAFIETFGHRAVYESELANPRWCEDPSYLLEQLRWLLQQPAQLRAPEVLARARRAAAELELRQMPWPARGMAWWLTQRARRTAALREAGKSALVELVTPLRRVMLEAGRRLTEAGVLEDANDISYLARADLEALARDEWQGRGARALVRMRRAQREAQLAAPAPPDLIAEAGAPIRTPARTSEHRGRGTLRGVAASGGQARGPARLVQHPAHAAHLQQGDVLVAPTTDPGWTPLFLRASALVTEVGGYLSHGAIVAREYGLPAVVNVAGAATLHDGEVITVDGDTGLIHR